MSLPARYVAAAGRRVCCRSFRPIVRSRALPSHLQRRLLSQTSPQDGSHIPSPSSPLAAQLRENHGVEDRWEEVATGNDADYYPRIKPDVARRISIRDFCAKYSYLENEAIEEDQKHLVTVYGLSPECFYHLINQGVHDANCLCLGRIKEGSKQYESPRLS